MNDNGSFRKKNGFTIAGNTLTRDKQLSLKAKGLYLLIMSYITFEDISLTKSFIFSLCTEKEKAFESIWNELKDRGYLKVYLQPSSKGWHVEYELLDEPKEGAHTIYLTANGDVSCTNLDREQIRKNKELEHTPLNGSNAEHTLLEGSNAQGNYALHCNAKGGDNISPLNNITDKKIINNHSFIHDTDRMKDSELKELILEELKSNKGIPYTYNRNTKKMKIAIQHLSDWNILHEIGYDDEFKQSVYNLAVDGLIEMACESEIKVYNKRRYTSINIIDKINQCIDRTDCINIRQIIEQAVEDYINATYKGKINHPLNYMKSCIADSFDTYEVKFGAYFNRTYSNYSCSN